MNTKTPAGGNLGPKVLSLAGLLILTAGLAILLLTLFVVRGLTHHSVWYLQKFYGPGGSAQPGYDQLFQYARDITNHRNALAVSLYSAIGVLTIVLGFVVILWSRDRKRLP